MKRYLGILFIMLLAVAIACTQVNNDDDDGRLIINSTTIVNSTTIIEDDDDDNTNININTTIGGGNDY